MNELPNFNRLKEKIKRDAMRYASVTALNFFKDSFFKQGFTDTSFQAWDKRNSNGRLGGAVLTDTGNLRDSLSILSRSSNRIVFGTNVPYASIHNQGGTLTVRVTPRSRKFFWYMFKVTEDPKWKWMALTKKESLKIRMPKRQFIGESQTLMKDLDSWLSLHIEKSFKQHLNNL